MPENPDLILTKWETGERGEDIERTRVLIKEQKQVYSAYHVLSKICGLSFLDTKISQDVKCMMAYKGRRSDDIVMMKIYGKPEEFRERGIPVKEIKERAGIRED